MASNFTTEKPALNFSPRAHDRWSVREFLLWPAWAYKVVAPRMRQRKLNLFQRATMGLCRTGVHRVDAIAEHLSVHVDLAAFIVSELSNLGYLDPYGLPTKRGLEVLENDSFETEEMVAGYVFQDPWNGDLWPRFVESLDYCEREFGEKRFPSILFGTTGKPKRYHPFMVLPSTNSSPKTPESREVVQAVAQHRKGIRYMDADDQDDEILGDFAASGVHFSRVSFIEEEPKAVFLLTYLYVPESGATDWYACDPFGLGQSVRLRRRVEAVMQHDKGLFGVVNKIVSETLHKGYEEQKPWLEAIQLNAGLEIDRRLTVDFRSHSAFKQMLELEAARQEMLQHGDACPPRKINETLRAALKVLEAVFSSFKENHPLSDIWKRVYVSRVDPRTGKEYLAQQPDRSVCAATYEGAFRELGFTTPIPEAFLHVTPGQVRSVSDYGEHWRLRPLVTATALLAQGDQTHPLAHAARRFPDLLVTIDEIAEKGAKAGHADSGPDPDPVTRQKAERLADKVYHVVSALLELGKD